MWLVTARKKRHGKHEWKTAPRLCGAARRKARKWVAVTALTPVLLLPATLMGAPSLFLAAPQTPAGERDPRDLGAGGRLPQAPWLSTEVLERAADPQQLATGAGPQVDLPVGSLGIPQPVLAAYVQAANQVARSDRGCGLHWSVLASIGRIESGHARSGSIDVLGTTVRAVLGPRLSGGADIAAIPDTDGGRYDGDPVWDRAVGPMQFIPSTWRKYAVDGNDDGVASPHNIHDASLAAAHYLCGGGGDLTNSRDLAAAVFRYNHSDSYVRTVLIWAAAYAKGVTPTPSELAPEVDDVLKGERLLDGPAVLALAPPPPAPAPGPAPAPPASPVPAEPPPLAPTSSPVVPPPAISVEPPEIPAPSPPNLTPPETTTPPGAISQPGTLPGWSQPDSPPGSNQPGTPPGSTQPGPPPGSTDPGTPPGSNQPGSPHGSSQPGTPPGSTQPGTPPGATPPATTQPGTPPETSAPPASAPGSTAPPSESANPPSPTPSAPSKTCDPAVLGAGQFAASEQSSGTNLQPGASDPHRAVPGQTVYVQSETAVLLEPCVVPDGFTAPPR
ncbi:lytic transglycosylase domain-containing protein [Saccharopolyspora phatthalungensis]|uniref:lytic transglycosylase domain-containing protein n=1 Tax=Saccharopolyspora phatthalungensis TaxID=664693 RepID=UPI001607C9BB|nr:lytic murein transglycosylase [Saccharopolyspora phatthalungensis]